MASVTNASLVHFHRASLNWAMVGVERVPVCCSV